MVNSVLPFKEEDSSLQDKLLHELRKALEPITVISRIGIGSEIQELLSYVTSVIERNSAENEAILANRGVILTIIMCVCDLSTNSALADGELPTGFSVLFEKIM